MAIKLTEHEIKTRVGISVNGERPQYPQHTIEGLPFSTSQTRRRVPTNERVKGTRYWYTTANVRVDEVDSNLLDQVTAYVEGLIASEKPSRKVKPEPVKND